MDNLSKGQQVKHYRSILEGQQDAFRNYVEASKAEIEQLRIRLAQAEDTIESYRRRAEEAEAASAVRNG